jgi:TonB family protein
MPHPALLLAAALLGASAPAPTLAAMPALTAALPMQADTLPPQVRDPRALRREIDRRYPRELFAEGVTGTVVLRVGVSPQGRTTEVAVDRSSGHPRLDEAAAAAVRAASFIPGSHRGQPVAATLRIPVTLRPPAPGEQAAPRERIDDHASARPDPEAAGWDERDERVERHRLASGAFERAQAAYQEALEALQEIGERWTPLRAALAEPKGRCRPHERPMTRPTPKSCTPSSRSSSSTVMRSSGSSRRSRSAAPACSWRWRMSGSARPRCGRPRRDSAADIRTRPPDAEIGDHRGRRACRPASRPRGRGVRDPGDRADRPVEAVSLLGEPLVRPAIAHDRRLALEADLAEARATYEADPGDADAIIWLGRRLAYLGRYHEAVETFSEGIRKHPDDARMYRHRGHRHITLRRLDAAVRDLDHAARLTRGQPDEIEPDGAPNPYGIPRSTLQSNVWYHLALAHYLKGDFDAALPAWREALEVSTNDDMWAATADWLYMTLRRLNRDAEAAAVLEPVHRRWRSWRTTPTTAAS